MVKLIRSIAYLFGMVSNQHARYQNVAFSRWLNCDRVLQFTHLLWSFTFFSSSWFSSIVYYVFYYCTFLLRSGVFSRPNCR